MGISGLLPFLKDASTNVNIKDYSGCTVAIDTYCWIYRGAFSCAEDLAMGTNAKGHVKYVERYVNRLLEWNIKPVMVFDGSCLPSKKGTEQKRKESKELYRKKAAQCLAEGKKNEARECFQRCIECTPKMALEVIQAMHTLGVDVLVAPYEADAQLAYLNKINVAQIIITEDSDLILFGCEKVLYKMDINGFGQLIQKEKIISITQFDSPDNFERFRWMCILSGCDYLENLPGVGLGKAKKLLKSVKKTDIENILRLMPKFLKMPGLIVKNEYIESFKRADNTFKFQIVFDPLKRKLVPINAYENQIDPSSEDLSYAGIFYDDELALQHSLGNIEVNNRQVVYNFNPEKSNYRPPPMFSNNPPNHMRSIWSKNYQPFDKSTPFFNQIKANQQEKTTPASTFGKTKTISFSSAKTTTVSQTTEGVKRKIEQIDLDDDSNSSSESSKSSSFPSTDSNDNEFKLSVKIDKKLKLDKPDLDSILKEYSVSSTSAADNLKSSIKGGFSSYFSSSVEQVTSPILNKSIHISPKQPFSYKNECQKSEFFSLESSVSHKSNSQEPESPIQVTRLSKNKTNVSGDVSSPIVVGENSSSTKPFQMSKAAAIELGNKVLSDMNQMRTTETSTNLLARFAYDARKLAFGKPAKTKGSDDEAEIDLAGDGLIETTKITTAALLEDIENIEANPGRISLPQPKSATKQPDSSKVKQPFKRPTTLAANNKKPIDTGSNKITSYLISNFQYSNAETKFKKSA